MTHRGMNSTKFKHYRVNWTYPLAFLYSATKKLALLTKILKKKGYYFYLRFSVFCFKFRVILFLYLYIIWVSRYCFIHLKLGCDRTLKGSAHMQFIVCNNADRILLLVCVETTTTVNVSHH